jgi:putative transposase
VNAEQASKDRLRKPTCQYFREGRRRVGNRLILFGEKTMRNAVGQFVFHYHNERPHQGLNNELIVPLEQPPIFGDKIETTERLGGLLYSYRRAA